MAFTHEFTEGDEVEVMIGDEGIGSRRAFYEATVKSSRQVNNKISVQHHHLLCDDRILKSQEVVNIIRLRPKPPQDLVNNFKLNDNVDVLQKKAWCKGIISKVDDNGDRFTVLIRGSENEVVVFKGELRVHREWNDKDGSWNPPPLMLKEVVQEEEQNQLQKSKLTQSQPPQVDVEQQQQNQLLSQPHHEFKQQQQSHSFFAVGDLVEVASENKEHVRLWVTAAIVGNIDENNFLVDYEYLNSGVEGTGNSGVKEDVKNIRPPPPNIPKVERFSLDEKVDARYMDSSWRSGGVISKVLSDSTSYKVRFRQTEKEEQYDHSELRVHREWNCRDGSWNPSPL